MDIPRCDYGRLLTGDTSEVHGSHIPRFKILCTSCPKLIREATGPAADDPFSKHERTSHDDRETSKGPAPIQHGTIYGLSFSPVPLNSRAWTCEATSEWQELGRSEIRYGTPNPVVATVGEGER